MREQIAKALFYAGTPEDTPNTLGYVADEILAIITEEIEKGLLTDEEIKEQINELLGQITDGTWNGVIEGWTIECKVGEFYEDWVAKQRNNLQAQLQKILSLLK